MRCIVFEKYIWMDFIPQILVLKELNKADKNFTLYCRVLLASLTLLVDMLPGHRMDFQQNCEACS